MQCKLTPEMQAEIIRLHEEGWRQIDIAIELQVSLNSIYITLHPEKKRPRLRDYGADRRVKITPEIEADMRKMYAAGFTYQQIADKYNISLSATYNHTAPGALDRKSAISSDVYKYKKTQGKIAPKIPDQVKSQYEYRKEIYKQIREGALQKI